MSWWIYVLHKSKDAPLPSAAALKELLRDHKEGLRKLMGKDGGWIWEADRKVVCRRCLEADGVPLPFSPFGDVHWELERPLSIPLEARDR